MTAPLRRPVVVDTKLAELHEARAIAANGIHAALESVHSALGERPIYRSRSVRDWPTTSAEAEQALRDKLAGGAVKSWDVSRVQQLLARIDTGRAEIKRLEGLIRPLSDEFAAKPWSRFFLVTSSTGGHIHRSMNCSTCHLRTTYAWLPNLSGLTEKDAVAAHGPLLCTVCYPSAPLDWTRGLEKKVDPKVCPGSGEPATWVKERRAYFCSVCKRHTRASSLGKAARHNKVA